MNKCLCHFFLLLGLFVVVSQCMPHFSQKQGPPSKFLSPRSLVRGLDHFGAPPRVWVQPFSLTEKTQWSQNRRKQRFLSVPSAWMHSSILSKHAHLFKVCRCAKCASVHPFPLDMCTCTHVSTSKVCAHWAQAYTILRPLHPLLIIFVSASTTTPLHPSRCTQILHKTQTHVLEHKGVHLCPFIKNLKTIKKNQTQAKHLQKGVHVQTSPRCTHVYLFYLQSRDFPKVMVRRCAPC